MPVISIGIAFFVFLRLCFLRNKCDNNGTGPGVCSDHTAELTEQDFISMTVPKCMEIIWIKSCSVSSAV